MLGWLTRSSRRGEFQVGGAGVAFFVLGLATLLAALHTQANLLFWGFGLMIGVWMVSLVMSWFAMRNLEVERVLPPHGVVGEELVLRYKVTNRSRWMPVFGLVVQETWGTGRLGWRHSGPMHDDPPRLSGAPIGWVLHVGPGQTVLADGSSWALERGPLAFEAMVLQSSFPLGLIRRVVEIRQPGRVLVYPHIFRFQRELITQSGRPDPGAKLTHRHTGQGEEVYGLREYRPGDSLKHIDWRRTAHTGELVSREMSQTSPPRMMVLLDLSSLPRHNSTGANGGNGMADGGSAGNGTSRGDSGFVDGLRRMAARLSGRPRTEANDAWLHARPNAERAVSLAASLVCDAYFHGHRVGLRVRGVPCRSFKVQRSLAHRTQILEALANLDLSQRGVEDKTVHESPSVIVRADDGQVSGPQRVGNAVAINASRLEDYVMELEEGSAALLGAQAVRHHDHRSTARAGT